MKKLLFCAALMFAAFFTSCSDSYDDSALKTEIENLQDRVEALESRLTSEVNALKAMIEALETDIAVAVVEVEGGYQVTIGGETFTIYNGADGQNGTPGAPGAAGTIITVVEVEGVYYWAIDGETTEYPVTGENGEDGQTPYIKDGKWYIGEEEVGPATGADGDSFFKSVVVNDNDTVTITLTDDTTFTLALAKEAKYADLKSIKFVPEYSDGKATIGYATGAADAFIEAKYEVIPAAAAEVIAANVKDASMVAIYTKTRAEAGDVVAMPISSIEAKDGIITVKASGKNLAAEVFSGAMNVSVRFAVQDATSGNASEYVPAVVSEALIVKSVAQGYQGAKLTWNEFSKAATYKVSYGDFTSEAIEDTEYVFAEESLTDAAEYDMTVTAYDADGKEVEECVVKVQVWTLANWTEPVFELAKNADGKYQFIAKNLVTLNYSYGGMTADGGKSTIEIYKDNALLYTLTNTTGVGTLNTWAGYGRWELKSVDNRKDWTWADAEGTVVSIKPDGNAGEVSAVPATFFTPGEYTIKYKIGYVMQVNATWATNNGSFVPQTEKEGATYVRFAGGKSDVYCVGGNVAVKTKEGTSSQTITITAAVKDVKVAAMGYQGASLTWDTELTGVDHWKVVTEGYESDNIHGALMEFAIPENSLTTKNKYSFVVKAYDADGNELAASLPSEETEIYTLCNWTEPVFHLNQLENGNYQFIASNLVTLNYAYGGAVTNDAEPLKSTIEIYKGEELVYTLKNGTSQSQLTTWAGYGRWHLGTMDNRKDWTWYDTDGKSIFTKDNGEDKEVNAVPASFFTPGEYTVKYKIGYVVNKNGQWATHNGSFVPQAEKEGATYVYFAGAKNDVLYIDYDKTAVRIFAKEGTYSEKFVIEAPEALFITTTITKGTQTATTQRGGFYGDGYYQGAVIEWTACDIAASYKIYYGDTSAEESVTIEDAATTKYTFEEGTLNKYDTYYFKVVALDSTGAEITSGEINDVDIYTLANISYPTFKFIPEEGGTYKLEAYNLTGPKNGYVDMEISIADKDGNVIFDDPQGVATINRNTAAIWLSYSTYAFKSQTDSRWSGLTGFTAGETYTMTFTPVYYPLIHNASHVDNNENRYVFKNALQKDCKADTKTWTFVAEGLEPEAPVVEFDVVGTWTADYTNFSTTNAMCKTDHLKGPAFTFVKLASENGKNPKDGQKYYAQYKRYSDQDVYFDIDTKEIEGKPGCYAIINLIDRENGNDKVTNNNSYYDKTNDIFYFDFVTLSNGSPGTGTTALGDYTVAGYLWTAKMTR